jgi:hypothetical protein
MHAGSALYFSEARDRPMAAAYISGCSGSGGDGRRCLLWPCRDGVSRSGHRPAPIGGAGRSSRPVRCHAPNAPSGPPGSPGLTARGSRFGSHLRSAISSPNEGGQENQCPGAARCHLVGQVEGLCDGQHWPFGWLLIALICVFHSPVSSVPAFCPLLGGRWEFIGSRVPSFSTRLPRYDSGPAEA